MKPRKRGGAARPRLALVTALLFGLTQVGLPLLLLGRPRPAPFGWQMYSAAPAAVELTLLLEGGERRVVATAAWVARERHELDLAELLPAHLCRSVPGVRAVLVRRSEQVASSSVERVAPSLIERANQRFECSP